MPDDATRSLAEARRIVCEVLRAWAPVVDHENRFPGESVAALREAGLLGHFVPRGLGGTGEGVRAYCSLAAVLGEECLSTAVIWAMHGQQVATVARSTIPCRDEVLAEIASRALLVASVTTEFGPRGGLLQSQTPLLPEDGQFRVVRRAPMVSYGNEADLFLATVQCDAESDAATLALLRRGDGLVVAEGPWNAMGMRGTQSVPMRFDVRIGRTRLIDEPFRALAARSMVPVGHVGWAAAWYGAARGAFSRVVRHLRAAAAREKREVVSEAHRRRLASLRLRLDLVAALTGAAAARLDALWEEDAPQAAYQDPAFTILVNNVKVAASRLSFEVVDGLIEICGVFDGYCEGGELGLDRVFRDLRSASLMYGNERLLAVNGNLVLVSTGGLESFDSDWFGGAFRAPDPSAR